MIQEDLIKKVKKGNRKAQKLLYDACKSSWYAICLRYNKNEDDALDVLQNGLIKIYTRIDLFDTDKGSFNTWSNKIIVNENLMFLRKKLNSFKVSYLEEELVQISRDETPLEDLGVQELLKLIQLLPPGYQTVFNLYAIEGYSHAEISELLGISVGTSKSQLFKARRMLQQKIEVLI